MAHRKPNGAELANRGAQAAARIALWLSGDIEPDELAAVDEDLDTLWSLWDQGENKLREEQALRRQQ